MASNFISDDFEESELQDNGYYIEVYETNYRFNKRFAVHETNSVGQLILMIVKEIGKENHFLFKCDLSVIIDN